MPLLREHFSREGAITNATYRRLCSVDAAAATRELRELVKLAVLVLCGARRGASYVAGKRLN